jgi:hypothetical protein
MGTTFDTVWLRLRLTSATARADTGLDGGRSRFPIDLRSLLLHYNRAGRMDSARFGYINSLEGTMSADLQFLEEWIPERMDPGTVFVLENQGKLGHADNPFVAVMSCPRCGTMGLITRRQLCGGETMICGGDVCSAEYRLDGENINFRACQ